MNMEDRKLLELAAKACGAKWSDYSDGSTDHWMMQAKSGSWINWNPLINDGDALRVAVQLQLTVCNEHVSAGAAYCTDACGDLIYPVADSGNHEPEVIPEDYAATRRAIVLAAAQIGKAMQEKH